LVASVRTVRRAGDATRVVLAILACGLVIVLARVGSAVLAQDEASGSHPVLTVPTPPSEVQWIVDSVRVAGTLRVLAIVIVVALVGRKARMVLDVALSCVSTVVVVFLVESAMRGHVARLHLGAQSMAVVPPVIAIAVASAAAGAGGPFLSRVSRRLLYALV